MKRSREITSYDDDNVCHILECIDDTLTLIIDDLSDDCVAITMLGMTCKAFRKRFVDEDCLYDSEDYYQCIDYNSYYRLYEYLVTEGWTYLWLMTVWLNAIGSGNRDFVDSVDIVFNAGEPNKAVDNPPSIRITHERLGLSSEITIDDICTDVARAHEEWVSERFHKYIMHKPETALLETLKNDNLHLLLYSENSTIVPSLISYMKQRTRAEEWHYLNIICKHGAVTILQYIINLSPSRFLTEYLTVNNNYSHVYAIHSKSIVTVLQTFERLLPHHQINHRALFNSMNIFALRHYVDRSAKWRNYIYQRLTSNYSKSGDLVNICINIALRNNMLYSNKKIEFILEVVKDLVENLGAYAWTELFNFVIQYEFFKLENLVKFIRIITRCATWRRQPWKQWLKNSNSFKLFYVLVFEKDTCGLCSHSNYNQCQCIISLFNPCDVAYSFCNFCHVLVNQIYNFEIIMTMPTFFELHLIPAFKRWFYRIDTNEFIFMWHCIETYPVDIQDSIRRILTFERVPRVAI